MARRCVYTIARGLRAALVGGDHGAIGRQRLFSTFPKWLPETSGGRARISTPLTQTLPGLSQMPAYTAPSERPPTEVTVLSNGVRVISEATPVRACMSWDPQSRSTRSRH